MIAIPWSEFFTDWIILIHSFLFSFERCSNLLKQKIGFCKICLLDRLISAQIFKWAVSKFQKTFSARCWRPELLIIKGAHRERNQPVPVRGFKTFGYKVLNIGFKIRGGAKNNQCHGTVALVRWAPLIILFNTLETKTAVHCQKYLTVH